MSRKITVQIIGDAENVPRGMRAAGATCDGRGRYVMAFNPQTGAVALARKDKGGSYALHTGRTMKEPTKVATEAKVVDAITRTVTSYKASAGPVSLKGRWSAHIACEPSGPQLVVRRNFTGYATLAIVSHMNGKWEYAVATTEKWFTGSSTVSAGGFGSFNAALNAGLKTLDASVAKACRVEHVGMNPASKSMTKKKASNAAKAKKTQRKIVGKVIKAKQSVRAKVAKAAEKKKAAKKTTPKKLTAAQKKAKSTATATRRLERVKGKIPKRFMVLIGKNVAVKAGQNKGAEGKVTDVHTRAPGGAVKVVGHSSGPVIEIQINGHKIGVRGYDKNGKLSVRQLKRAPKPLEKQIKAAERKAKKAAGGKRAKAPGVNAMAKLEKAQKKAMAKLEKAQKQAAVYAAKQRKAAEKSAKKAEREAKALERAAKKAAGGKRTVAPKTNGKKNGNGKKTVAKKNGGSRPSVPRQAPAAPAMSADIDFDKAMAAMLAQAGM